MRYQEIHNIARRKVARKKWFNRHFAIFIGFSIFFILLEGSSIPDFGFRHFFWTIANSPFSLWLSIIVTHYLWVYGFPLTGALSEQWEEKEMKKELNKLYTTHPIDEEDYQGITFEDRMELKELNRLKDKWEPDQYV